MGNEEQIKKRELMRQGSVFLPDEIRDLEGKAEVYSLEEEFAHTKKNKNYKLHLFVAGFIAAIVGLTYLYSLYLERDSRNVQINIQEFEDLRLKEFLQTARHDESSIDLLRMKMQMLQVEMLNAVLQVRRETLNKEFEVLEKQISEDEKTKLVEDIRAQEAKRIKAVEASYRGQIAQKQQQIWVLQEQMQKSEKSAKDSKMTSALNNEDKLYKMKMKTLKQTQQTGIGAMKAYYDNYVKYLVLKYNPVFKTSKYTGIIAEGKEKQANVTLKELNPAIGKDIGFAKDRSDKLRENVANNLLLIERLLDVPYINSVAPALKTINNLTRAIIMEYETLWTRLTRLLTIKNNQLKGFNYAFKQHLTSIQKSANAESGYILDPRNEQSIIIYLLNEKSVNSGEIATVLRGKSDYIAKIQFFKSSGAIRAKVVDKTDVLRPLDRIMRKAPDKKE